MDNKNNKNKNKNTGDMTVKEAGRMGGEATSRTHDQNFYRDIGRQGGEARGKSGEDKEDDRSSMSRKDDSSDGRNEDNDDSMK